MRRLLKFGAFLFFIALISATITLSGPWEVLAVAALFATLLCLKGLSADSSDKPNDLPFTAGEFVVVITSTGPRKIDIIRRVRSINGTSLRDAKESIDKLPAFLSSGIAESDATRIAAEFRDAGAEAWVIRALRS